MSLVRPEDVAVNAVMKDPWNPKRVLNVSFIKEENTLIHEEKNKPLTVLNECTSDVQQEKEGAKEGVSLPEPHKLLSRV